LLFVGYALLNSEDGIAALLFVNLILAMIIISLGIAQIIPRPYFSEPCRFPPQRFVALSTLYSRCAISGAMMYRPNSVFVSTGRFANFLLVVWLLVFGFSGYLLLRHKRGRGFAFLVFGLTFAALSLCASRGIVLWSIGSAFAGSVAFVWARLGGSVK